MDEPFAAAGPPPFRFQPSVLPAIEGPAFTPAYKVLVTLLVVGCVAWAASLWFRGAFGPGVSTTLGWFLAALAMMVWTWAVMLRSRTAITPDEIRQSWIWRKRLEVRELAFARVIRVRGLEWLVAPRLYARTLLGKFGIFYVADARVLQDCERLCSELRSFRGL